MEKSPAKSPWKPLAESARNIRLSLPTFATLLAMTMMRSGRSCPAQSCPARFQQPRNACIDCQSPLPPGRAGRRCKGCRVVHAEVSRGTITAAEFVAQQGRDFRAEAEQMARDAATLKELGVPPAILGLLLAVLLLAGCHTPAGLNNRFTRVGAQGTQPDVCVVRDEQTSKEYLVNSHGGIVEIEPTEWKQDAP